MPPPQSAPLRPTTASDLRISTPSTAASTPALASAALPMASSQTAPPLPHTEESNISSSPALSTATRKSRAASPTKSRKKPRRRNNPKPKAPPVPKKSRTVAALPTQAEAPAEPIHPPISSLMQARQQRQISGLSTPVSMPLSRDSVGHCMERLLSLHDAFGPRDESRNLEFWNHVIGENFAPSGCMRLELGGQIYEMPASTAGRFYSGLFNEGAVVSIRFSLGKVKALQFAESDTALMSFHSVCMITAYASGRRVEESGSLRVCFNSAFSIRVWTFESSDTTVLLPRKRPSAPDDMPARVADTTIARNLDWPKDPPPARRRKSAHGKMPADECVLPACALQHLEIANTMSILKDLITVQVHSGSLPVMDALNMWTSSVNPAPVSASKSASDRKRVRRKSTAPPLPKDDPVSIALPSSSSVIPHAAT
ncbi:hypothetical protein IWW36_001111 [Coemansia brasiliensis]|uniref:Uncharacterized protein n=1 Tax=Coemansia brasiliensis TaxID=2650707 RepID=A0A9W8M2C1_9FUNG|nr:hypothetical protein IWW36_001111 [Coemansia brasiliensis]